jgi:hypothetical protein
MYLHRVQRPFMVHAQPVTHTPGSQPFDEYPATEWEPHKVAVGTISIGKLHAAALIAKNDACWVSAGNHKNLDARPRPTFRRRSGHERRSTADRDNPPDQRFQRSAAQRLCAVAHPLIPQAHCVVRRL